MTTLDPERQRKAKEYARTGRRLWDKALKHKTRPVIIDDTIYCEGGAWKLLTGDSIRRLKQSVSGSHRKH